MNVETKFGIGVICIILVIIIITLFNPITFVGAGQRGVVLNWGAVSDNIFDEGLHFKVPFVQRVVKMDVTTQKEEQEASAASKDLQIVTAQVAINYHLNPNEVNRVYQTLKKDYNNRVIAPTIEEFIKKTTAKYTAEELITKREEVKQDLRESITISLENSNIIVDDIFITNFEFSEQFDKAIESKVTAEQDALRAKNELERVKMEAQQRIEEATAEAEAIRIQASAITQQGGKDYVSLKWIEAWKSGGAKVPQFITDGNGFIFNMAQ